MLQRKIPTDATFRFIFPYSGELSQLIAARHPTSTSKVNQNQAFWTAFTSAAWDNFRGDCLCQTEIIVKCLWLYSTSLLAKRSRILSHHSKHFSYVLEKKFDAVSKKQCLFKVLRLKLPLLSFFLINNVQTWTKANRSNFVIRMRKHWLLKCEKCFSNKW